MVLVPTPMPLTRRPCCPFEFRQARSLSFAWGDPCCSRVESIHRRNHGCTRPAQAPSIPHADQSVKSDTPSRDWRAPQIDPLNRSFDILPALSHGGRGAGSAAIGPAACPSWNWRCWVLEQCRRTARFLPKQPSTKQPTRQGRFDQQQPNLIKLIRLFAQGPPSQPRLVFHLGIVGAQLISSAPPRPMSSHVSTHVPFLSPCGEPSNPPFALALLFRLRGCETCLDSPRCRPPGLPASYPGFDAAKHVRSSWLGRVPPE